VTSCHTLPAQAAERYGPLPLARYAQPPTWGISAQLVTHHLPDPTLDHPGAEACRRQLRLVPLNLSSTVLGVCALFRATLVQGEWRSNALCNSVRLDVLSVLAKHAESPSNAITCQLCRIVHLWVYIS
jgi:hypothetical protein